MTRRVVEKLCTKKVCVDFLAPIIMHFVADTDADEYCFGTNFSLQIQTQLFFAI